MCGRGGTGNHWPPQANDADWRLLPGGGAPHAEFPSDPRPLPLGRRTSSRSLSSVIVGNCSVNDSRREAPGRLSRVLRPCLGWPLPWLPRDGPDRGFLTPPLM